MNLIKKKAPGRLSRAIVTLAARTGNKLMRVKKNDKAPSAACFKEPDPAAKEYEGQLQVSERTTITVETETLLIVRRERMAP